MQLNNTWDQENVHHILRMKDHFIHHKHLCIAFELLSSNLYELIKQNSFRGLSTSLVRVFTSQLLDALTVLNEARLIHCDLKPENILLNSSVLTRLPLLRERVSHRRGSDRLSSPDIKVIDFGSACHERQTVYTYIQSRFYRSPEVILGRSLSRGGRGRRWADGKRQGCPTPRRSTCGRSAASASSSFSACPSSPARPSTIRSRASSTCSGPFDPCTSNLKKD